MNKLPTEGRVPAADTAPSEQHGSEGFSPASCSALVWCAAALQLVGRPLDVIGVGGQPPRTIREMLDRADDDLAFGDPYAGLREAWALLNGTDLADRPQEIQAWLNHWAPVARHEPPHLWCQCETPGPHYHPGAGGKFCAVCGKDIQPNSVLSHPPATTNPDEL